MKTEISNPQISNSTTHTPGPWCADKWAPGFTVSAPESHYSVCHLEDCNNAEPNARLIAAAPDLLAALQMIVAAAPDEAQQLATDARGKIVCCYSTARAAIAKATGATTPQTENLNT